MNFTGRADIEAGIRAMADVEYRFRDWDRWDALWTALYEARP